MVRILVSDRIHEDGTRLLKEIGEVEMATGLRPEELISKIKDFDVLVVRSATKVTREVIEAGKKLKVIARAGSGLDNIDVAAAEERGISVISAPEAPTVAVAELTLGLMLSFARKIPRADSGMKEGKWEKKELMGIELSGKILGIIGTGRIGRAVAERARAFGMQLLFYDIYEDREFAERVGGRYVSLEEVLKNSDFITIHVPLLPTTRHMIGEREFQLMKPNAVFINTSRGDVLDESALVNALKSNRIMGACLDVFENEPPIDSPLLKLPNVVLTPHIGASTVEAQREAAVIVAKKIKGAIG